MVRKQLESSGHPPDRRVGRRSTLKGLAGAGMASLAAFELSRRAEHLAAQDATPEAASDADEHSPAFLFVQLAEGGTWTPKPGEGGVFLLTLAGTSSQTLYFSDRPDRIVGAVSTGQFLGQLGFTPFNPPNAAAVVQTPDGTQDVLVIELFNPVYTQTFGADGGDVLTYEARVLEAYEGDGLAPWAGEADDDELPWEFSQVSLFIDDCPNIEWCYNPIGGTAHERIGPVPFGPYARCYNTFKGCIPCGDSTFNDYNARRYDQLCNAYSTCTSRQCIAL